MTSKSQAEAYKRQGNDAYHNGNFKDAITFYSQAIALDPTNSTYYSNRSGAYTASVQYVEAECDAYATIRLKPEWVKGYTRLGNALIGEHRYDDAIYALKLAQKIDPKDPKIEDDIKVAQAQASKNKNQPIFFGVPLIFKIVENKKYQQLIETPKILSILRKIQESPESAPEFAQDPVIADLIQHSFQVMHSLDFFDVDPPNTQDGIYSYRHSNQTIIKESEKNQKLKNKAKNEDKIAAYEFNNEGEKLYAKGEYGSAIQKYSYAINANPDNALYYLNRAAGFKALDLPMQALADINKAINYQPNVISTYLKRASCYLDLGEYIKAYECYEEVLSLSQKNEEAIQRMDYIIDKMHEHIKNIDSSFMTFIGASDLKNALQTIHKMKSIKRIAEESMNKEEIETFMKNPIFRSSLNALIQNGIL
ncbi:hypothetical protein TRFO_03571 [Tritrichomonas foetus]|uniref:TPR Domain containing protein n=1 Tax=Tritrichomonas foetus TaxID=1144522 RepID=A0A1J4KMN7_9EUKA|nr:hypothetical protein TRFO_03571 [Tritrichomonas foetus]|eukprot:OHT12569.1 hypothetical protein TRFO_03571 [Tritrichomonas foetus]